MIAERSPWNLAAVGAAIVAAFAAAVAVQVLAAEAVDIALRLQGEGGGCRLGAALLALCDHGHETAARGSARTIALVGFALTALAGAACWLAMRESISFPFAMLCVFVALLCFGIDMLFDRAIAPDAPLLRWQYGTNMVVGLAMFIIGNAVAVRLRASWTLWLRLYGGFAALTLFYLGSDLAIRLAAQYVNGGIVMLLVWSLSIVLNCSLLIAATVSVFSSVRSVEA